MSTAITPSFIYHCASDMVANGVYVCKSTGTGETFLSKFSTPPNCCYCGERMVTHAEMLHMEGLREIDAMAEFDDSQPVEKAQPQLF